MLEGFSYMGWYSRFFFTKKAISITYLLNDINNLEEKQALINLFKIKLWTRYQGHKVEDKAPNSQLEELRRLLGKNYSFILRKKVDNKIEKSHVWTYRYKFSCIFVVCEGKFIKIYTTQKTSPDTIFKFLTAFYSQVLKLQVSMVLFSNPIL